MKCLILAAGYATRLYPITENFPKPLLAVGEKTILDWLVDDIASGSMVDEFIVISNHKFAEHFNKWALNKCTYEPGLNITVVDDGTSTNETRLGAVVDVKYALEKLGIDDDVMVIAGDNVLDFSLCDFLAYAKNKNTSCVMRYYEPDRNKIKKSACLVIDDNDYIEELSEKPEEPKTNWCCPPFYIYMKQDIARINEAIENGCKTDAPGSLVAWMCKKSPMHAFAMPGKRYDIGNIESYEEVKRLYKGILK